ncbi:MAG: hypothetical protein V3T60_03005, partial [Candidatus Binatia bacterium]
PLRVRDHPTLPSERPPDPVRRCGYLPHRVPPLNPRASVLSSEQDATRRILVRKGMLTNEEVLEEIKVVRREMEGKRGLWR